MGPKFLCELLNFSINPDSNTYRESVTTSILHVIQKDTVSVEIEVPHFIDYVLSKDFWLDDCIEILTLMGRNIFCRDKEIP